MLSASSAADSGDKNQAGFLVVFGGLYLACSKGPPKCGISRVANAQFYLWPDQGEVLCTHRDTVGRYG